MSDSVSRRDFLRFSIGGMVLLTRAAEGGKTPTSIPQDKSTHGIDLRLARYDGNELIDAHAVALAQNHSSHMLLKYADSEWDCGCEVTNVSGRVEAKEFHLTFKVASGSPRNHSVAIVLTVDPWSPENYVLIPAALYNGNRFESRHLEYPPLLSDPKDIGPNVPTIITDVPRLNISSGPSRVQLVSGDMSTPAMGFYAPQTNQGFWLLTEQRTRVGDTGLGIEESLNRDRAFFTLTAPRVREKYKYHMCTTEYPSDDRGVDFKTGDELHLRFRTYSFPCSNIQGLFDGFVEIRKDLSGLVHLYHQLPFSAAWKIQEEKYKYNWVEEFGNYYTTGLPMDMYEDWQPGWVGGLQVTYPLLMDGNETSRSRVFQNFDFVFPNGAGPSGYLRGIAHEGKWYNDGFQKPYADKWVLVRKSADCLYFMLKQLMLLEIEKGCRKPSLNWIDGTRRCADAFVRTWSKFEQFGQFLDINTGDVIVGGSASAGIAPAGLALAAGYFKQPEYMRVATAAADSYYDKYVSRGLTTGGPGEACQCPDSESAFGLLESFVVLYEATGDRKWLKYASEMAHQCATWMVSYDFQFPPDSPFGKLDMHAAGSVFANAQNKHSAPGICTLSGNSLFKLYRYTGRKLYLGMIQELAHNLPQYLSRSDRPIKEMPAGWMNERVQLSDWLEPIGDIFYQSTCFEVSNMLSYVEVPGLYVQPDTGFFCAIDHIDVQVCAHQGKELTLMITNPTSFDASIKVICEDSTDAKRILGQNYLFNCPRIMIGKHSSRMVTFPLTPT